MRRRDFLKTVGCGTAALLSGCVTETTTTTRRATPRTRKRKKKSPANAPASRPPNILWLISEDTCPDMGCYGNPLVRTPNIDRLAAEGARFTNAFATAPVCSASRSCFMTGMYQTSIGAHNHRSHRADGYMLPAPAAVITEYFRRAGYFTCNCEGLSYKKPGKTDWNFTPAAPAFDGTDWSQRKAGQPFFAQINFNMTHRTFQRDKANPIDPAKVELPPCYPDHPLARRDWANYLESIQVLDSEIGVALQWLQKEGELDNTIIAYFADNGQPHVRGKQWLYESGIHVPLIVRWPGRVQAGTVVDDLVSTVDLAPTFLTAIGVEPPKHLQGYNILGEKKRTREYVFAARDRCDGTVDHIRCVRSKPYKYIRNYYPDRPYTQFNAYKKLQYPVLTLMQVLYKEGKLTPDQAKFMGPRRPEELYDLQEDPHELRNLAENTQYAKVLREHRRKLDEWIKVTGDQGETPEDPKVVEREQNQMAKNFVESMEKRDLSPTISDEGYLKWWEQKLLG
ncbi:MAG: sulfatase [Phycisphaerae bacterium]|nr:sulfatase [Phycisphaerae bacterium]